MNSRGVLVALLLALVGALWFGCGGTSRGGGLGGSAAAGNALPGGSGGTGGVGCLVCGGGGAGAGQPTGVIVIDPTDVVLDVTDGDAVPTQAFTATINGQDVTASVTWSFDRPNVGTMQNGNVFTPTGEVAGPGTLSAYTTNAEGSTTVTVNVSHAVDNAGLSAQEIAAFDSPGGSDPSLNIVYPFDGTVMPLRVASPEIQWNGGAAGDVYRLRMSSEHYEYVEYFAAPASPMKKVLDQTLWEQIQFSGTGPVSDPLTIELTRQSGGTVYQPKHIALGVAQGFVYGAVYYWQLPDACGGPENGQILRIRADSPETETFYQTTNCWGCHTVSRDGRNLMASWTAQEDSIPYSMQSLRLSADAATLGAITTSDDVTGTFSAYNHDGTRILYSNDARHPETASLTVIDSTTGARLLSSALGAGCGEPAWSPDGTRIAAVCGLTGGPTSWTFDSNSGDLVVAQISANGDSLSGEQTIVPKGALAGRPAYPSFSPDSLFIAYSRPTLGSRSSANGTLWLVGADGAGARELVRAEHGDSRNFNPVFAPKGAGGYNWVVFMSRRNYGNQLVNADRQQLWMFAVGDPPGTTDPSHPPFYLRGQEFCGKSENAYYALEPCKDLGEDCKSGIECCNGHCVYDVDLQRYVCGEPPDPDECVQTGNACEQDEDCCDFPEVTCYQGFCSRPPPR